MCVWERGPLYVLCPFVYMYTVEAETLRMTMTTCYTCVRSASDGCGTCIGGVLQVLPANHLYW